MNVYQLLDQVSERGLYLRDNAGNYYHPRDVQAILDEPGNDAGWGFVAMEAVWTEGEIRLLDANGYQQSGEPLYHVVPADQVPD